MRERRSLSCRRWRGVLNRLPVAMAVNRTYATTDTRLIADDELALIPRISGGVEVHVRVTDQPLSPEALTRSVGGPGAGATPGMRPFRRVAQITDWL